MKRNGSDGATTATAGASADAGLDRRQLLHALQRVRSGDFSVQLPGDWTGLDGKIADAFNEIVAANQKIAAGAAGASARSSARKARRASARSSTTPRAPGARWRRSVNTLIDDLLRPTTEVTGAIAAVAQGHLTQTMRLDVDGRPLEGEFLRSATIVNTMIEQLGVFTSEVTRVAREVGSDGKLGGQAQVPGVSGVWKDLTESRQLDGEQPDRAGAQHLRGHDRRRQRRPLAQDHGRRARRDPPAEGGHQHDGRSAARRSRRR